MSISYFIAYMSYTIHYFHLSKSAYVIEGIGP